MLIFATVQMFHDRPAQAPPPFPSKMSCLGTRRCVCGTTPLLFWKEQASDYPILSTVARRIFCISASSAQSERDFSSVGRVITDARSQLSAAKVEAIELVRWGLAAGLLN